MTDKREKGTGQKGWGREGRNQGNMQENGDSEACKKRANMGCSLLVKRIGKEGKKKSKICFPFLTLSKASEHYFQILA